MRVKCPVKMRVGLGDYICPPSTTLTLYNAFKCDKWVDVVQTLEHQLQLPNEDEHFYKYSSTVPTGKYRHFKGNEYEVIGIAKCRNPKCVTNHQPIKTRFTTVEKNNEIKLLCHFCEKISSTKSVF